MPNPRRSSACDCTTQATPPRVVQSGERQEPGSASLPCTTVAVRRRAGVEERLERFCAIPLWITAGSFISHPCFRHPLTQICRGAQLPASSVQGGCSPPRPPASYASECEYGELHPTTECHKNSSDEVKFVHMLCMNLLLYLSEGQSSVLVYSMKIANHLFPYNIHHLFSPESLVLTQKYPYSHRMMYNCIEGQKISHSIRTACHF